MEGDYSLAAAVIFPSHGSRGSIHHQLLKNGEVSTEDVSEGEVRVKKVESQSDIVLPTRSFSIASNPNRIRSSCRNLVPGWAEVSKEDINVFQIMSGLTNQLFRVSVARTSVVRFNLRHRRVLFRIYGNCIGKLYDSKFEVEVFKTLGRYYIAPRLIAEFEGGRIEEWIDGKPLSVRDLQNPSIICAVATILGRFHQLHRTADNFPDWPQTPCLFPKLNQWMIEALNVCDASQDARIEMLGLHEWAREVEHLEQYLWPPNCQKTVATEIAFCHNDTQENNILRTGTCLRLIDFEYSNFNYPAFDIGNFFVESMIDYTYPTYPFYKVDLTQYPCEEKRRMFASAYLSEVLDAPILPSSEDIIVPFLEVVERFTLASHLLWAFWSVVRVPQVSSCEEFDFVGYAADRFRMYEAKRRELMAAQLFQ